MTAPFECEVRFPIDDIEAFRRRIRTRGATARLDYAFTDHYYRPAPAGHHGEPGHGDRSDATLSGTWDPGERALRIRDHHRPPQDAEVLLTHVDIAHAEGMPFKRSRFAEGKVCLYRGPLDACRRVVASLGFVPWIVVRKQDGRLFEFPGIGEFVIEHVQGVGWMGEVEAAGGDATVAAAAIRRTLTRLGVPPEAVTADPVAVIVARSLAAMHGA